MWERFVGIKLPQRSRIRFENACIERQRKPQGRTSGRSRTVSRNAFQAIFIFVDNGTECFRIDAWTLQSLNSFMNEHRNILGLGTQRRNMFQQVKWPTMMNTTRMQWCSRKHHPFRLRFWSGTVHTIKGLANCNSKAINGGARKFLKTNLENTVPTEGIHKMHVSGNISGGASPKAKLSTRKATKNDFSAPGIGGGGDRGCGATFATAPTQAAKSN